MTAINLSPSVLGFNPNGDETMAFSNCLSVCKSLSSHTQKLVTPCHKQKLCRHSD